MRRIPAVLLALFLIVAAMPLALADGSYCLGRWVSVAIDYGDGVKTTEFDGMDITDYMRIDFKEDGTFTVDWAGTTIQGDSWGEDLSGLVAVIGSETLTFEKIGSQLVNDSDGVLIYFEKEEKKKSGGLLGLIKASKFVGKWVATGADQGDGKIVSEIGDMNVADLITLKINRDGTLVLTSMVSGPSRRPGGVR
jgi:hypothetical protein